MEKKCYRFLYGEMDGCFVHIGEIKDMRSAGLEPQPLGNGAGK